MTDFCEYLRIEGGEICCVRCGHRLGKASENFKLGARYAHRALTDISALNVDPQLLIDDEIVLREYYCPGCGGLVGNEITKPSDPPRHDVDLGGVAA